MASNHHLLDMLALSWQSPERYPVAAFTTAAAFSALMFYVFFCSGKLLINWPFLGMLPGLLTRVNVLHQKVTELLSVTGCSFIFKGPWFTGMDIFLTCDPANVNHVYNTNFANFPKGDELADIFDILGGGIFTADDESWKVQRRMVHALLSEKYFKRFVADAGQSKVKSAILPLLERVAETGSIVDLCDVFLRFTFDATCTLVMGVDPCCLSPEMPVVPFAKAMDDSMEILLFRHVVPNTWWKAMRWLGIGPERRMTTAQKAIDEFVEKHVARKREELYKSDDDTNNRNPESAPVPDMLLSIIKDDGLTAKGPLPFDTKSTTFLRDMGVSLMLAGRDTTGMGLSWFFWLISTNPHVEAKILDEIKTSNPSILDRNGELTSPQALGSLVYLHAALCEALRLYPPVPFEHKSVVKPDMMPSGHHVGPEMKVLISLYAMARMEGVWGKDCSEFKPERWINENGKIKHEPSYKFMSFNSGARTCLGKDVAFTQMKVVVVYVMTRFKVHVVEGHKVTPRPSIILHMSNGLKVRIRKRVEAF